MGVYSILVLYFWRVAELTLMHLKGSTLVMLHGTPQDDALQSLQSVCLLVQILSRVFGL